MRIFDNIQKIATGKGDHYINGCVLGFVYFKNCYKMIAIDLSKHQALDNDPKAIQQIKITGNLYQAQDTTMLFIIEELKIIILDFSKWAVRLL